MKKWKIQYRQKYIPSPMSFWVHKHLNSEVWIHAGEFEPELPKPIPGKGYPFLVVNALGVELLFSSIEEAEHFLYVIRQKNMPTSIQLSRKLCENYGPNTHWLSKLPAKIKPWSKREKLIPIIENGIREFKTLYS